MENNTEVIRNFLLLGAETTKSTGAGSDYLAVILLSKGVRVLPEDIEEHCDTLIRKGLLAEKQSKLSGRRLFVLTEAGREHLYSEGLL
jgi:hypothetical protein